MKPDKLAEVKKALLAAKEFADGWPVDAEGYARVIPEYIRKAIDYGLWQFDDESEDMAQPT
jgi:hypothetical protein